MKKTSDETVIRNAQTGYLTKDEYRYFQRCLRTDKPLAEKAEHVLLADGLLAIEHVNREAGANSDI